MTVGDLTDIFGAVYLKAKGKPWGGRSRLDSHVLPVWRDRPAQDITKSDVNKLLDGLVANGMLQGVNRVRSALSVFFKFAASKDHVPASPVRDVAAPINENTIDRTLYDAELLLLWTAAEACGATVAAYVKMLLLTAQRRSEVAGMRWSCINFATGVWTIPRTETKAKREHHVPLSLLTMRILKSVPRFDGCDYVFTTNGKTPISGFSKIKIALDKHLVELNGGTPLAGWSFHDLRRTAAANLAKLEVPPHIIEAALNHAPQGLATKKYVWHPYLPEKRRALRRLALHVAKLVKAA